MSELLTHTFNIPEDLDMPLGRHALELVNGELNRLLLFQEYPDVLQIEFTPAQLSERMKKGCFRMPDGLEPVFSCTKTPRGSYEVDAIVPFSMKTRSHIGACSLKSTIDFLHSRRSSMGSMQLRSLERTFAIPSDSFQYPIRAPQRTAPVALRDFADTLISLRNTVPIEGFTYDWKRTPSLQE